MAFLTKLVTVTSKIRGIFLMNTKIIAAAVAGVFAVGVAVAADVNVYGKVDIGVICECKPHIL